MNLFDLTQENPTLVLQVKASDLIDFSKALLNNQPSKEAIAPSNDLGGIEMASEVTGYTVGTLYQKVAKNEIPFFKKGSRLFFSKKVLEDWIRGE